MVVGITGSRIRQKNEPKNISHHMSFKAHPNPASHVLFIAQGRNTEMMLLKDYRGNIKKKNERGTDPVFEP
jgi:hypothetical protein